MIIGILKNQNNDSVKRWELACQQQSIHYKIIDLVHDNWLENINNSEADLFLHRPPCDLDRYKRLFDERLYILSQILKKKIFPSYTESVIYENKRMLSYFLAANNIPHPRTKVFYTKQDAFHFVRNSPVPIVGKSNIGAAGSGVKIMHTKDEANSYIKSAFGKKGIRRRYGPNKAVGTPRKWIRKALSNPDYLTSKLRAYTNIYRDSQYGYVIFQEHIPHDYEWRIAKIGESYFGYKKIVDNEKASGAKKIELAEPPLALLDFVRNTALDSSIFSAAFDIFEANDTYLINEIQTIFGHSKPHILIVNKKPGRYYHCNGKWTFEEGDFNANESYNLRLKAALSLYE